MRVLPLQRPPERDETAAAEEQAEETRQTTFLYALAAIGWLAILFSAFGGDALHLIMLK